VKETKKTMSSGQIPSMEQFRLDAVRYIKAAKKHRNGRVGRFPPGFEPDDDAEYKFAVPAK